VVKFVLEEYEPEMQDLPAMVDFSERVDAPLCVVQEYVSELAGTVVVAPSYSRLDITTDAFPVGTNWEYKIFKVRPATSRIVDDAFPVTTVVLDIESRPSTMTDLETVSKEILPSGGDMSTLTS
jgi:hypothetical protein